MLEHHLQKKRVKEKNIYKLVYQIIKKGLNDQTRMLDIGCGNGDFLNFVFLKKKIELFGLELDKKLFKFAKKNYPNIEFINKDFNKFKIKKKFDIITALSVASHFESIEKFLNKIKKISNTKSNIVITGIFNPNNIDVYLKYRFKKKIYQGHNQHNILRIYKWADKNNYKIKVKNETLPFTISKKNIFIDPARSFTTILNKRKITMNGLQVIYNIKIIHLSR
jgi:cyclopropane fatty-acyl-phospholipid synthase-like methyltransferase